MDRLYVCVLSLLLAVMCLLLFQVDDPHQIALCLMAVALYRIGMPIRLSTGDKWLCVLVLYECVSCVWAVCPIPAIRSAFCMVYCLTTYFLVRRLQEERCDMHLAVTFLPIGAALLLSLGSFWVFRNSVLDVGFADTYHFRFLFRPLGYITNIWSEVLLLLLGWICMVRRHSGTFICCCLLAIWFSFSRGAYIATGIYLVGGLFCFKIKREKLYLLLAGVFSFVLVCCLCPEEVKTTLQMNRTVSQRQSTESRIDGTQAAWKAFKERPLLGYGNRNFTYAVDHELNQDSRRSFTSFAPNIVMQLLVEKGITGTLIYVVLVVLAFRALWRRREERRVRVAVCTLVALCVKDMSQATLLHTLFTLWMTFILLAFLFYESCPANISDSSSQKRCFVVPGIAFLTVFMWNFSGWKKFADPTGQFVRQAFEMMKDGDFASGSFSGVETHLEQASVCHPEDLQIRYLCAWLTLRRGELEQAEAMLACLTEKYPQNSLYTWSMGEIHYLKGNRKEALSACVEAVRNMPRLLTHVRMEEWKRKDRCFYRALHDSLSILKPSAEATPSDYARYGYIARWCGNSCADEYLRVAVDGLPNLATPWHLLGDDRKYRLLLYGVFRQNLGEAELPEQVPMTDVLLFEMSCMVKLQNWYGEVLVAE